jgi:signal transduction histidine kinase
MRERVEALDGSMARDTSSGTRLTVTIPVRNKQEAIA